MKLHKRLGVLAGVCLMAWTVQVQAAEVPELAKTKSCTTCHSVDKSMGKAPTFLEVAKKYHGVANAAAMLEQKVMKGGVGHWGAGAMPGAGSRPEVSADEAKTLVAWVLSLH